ncbi:MAG: LysM peptidoglycan-binding domain-containing protein [Verrucomicrobia bacterium]|nr:LysM peptidoglycan-binding domain-containing protein [Verrucomicrobiota bacterium]MDA1065486.1 LysM peptidoglycan-binding domain-containing protein [Verrucomicrobiota bacterium]
MKLKQFTIYFSLLVVPFLWVMGQNYSPPTRMVGGAGTASLSQDVALLKEQLGEMRFEVERLLRENESLQLRIKKVEAQSSSAVSDVVFRQELASLYAEINRLNKTQREELLTQISKQIRALAKEIEKTPTTGGSSQPSVPVVFDPKSYPQTGILYIVKPGDTLSKIASSVGSTVSYIIHANEIPDPDRLKIGRELFLPIDNQN